MRLLAKNQDSEVSYTERKFSALLANPVLSYGTLAFRRPDRVEKHAVAPRRESYVFAGDELILTRNGSPRRIPLSSQPLLAALAASLRGVLLGDAVLLQKYFKLTVTGDESAWRLELVPLDASISRYVERVRVAGIAGRVIQIETLEAGGDRSVLQVR